MFYQALLLLLSWALRTHALVCSAGCADSVSQRRHVPLLVSISNPVDGRSGLSADGTACLPCAPGYYCASGSLNNHGYTGGPGMQSLKFSHLGCVSSSIACVCIEFIAVGVTSLNANIVSYGIASDASGSLLYASDYANHRIVTLNPASGQLVVLAGTGAAGFVNGNSSIASFSSPAGLALDSANLLLYICDRGTCNSNGQSDFFHC